MDPNVQIALITIVTTTITTMGIIAVAVINNRKERKQSAEAGVESAAGLDEREVLERMLSLISENERKEATINTLRSQLRDAQSELASKKRELDELKDKNDGGRGLPPVAGRTRPRLSPEGERP